MDKVNLNDKLRFYVYPFTADEVAVLTALENGKNTIEQIRCSTKIPKTYIVKILEKMKREGMVLKR